MVLELIVTILEIFTDPIKEYIITPLKNHISYPFTCDSKVQKLHHEVQQLQNKRDRLQQSVEAATRDGEEIYPNVTEWLSSAEKDIEEAEKLVQGKEDAMNTCCSGFCPNLKTRYQLSKKAHKKAAVMDEQLKSEEGLYPIAFRLPLQPIVEPSVYSREALPSRVRILNEIMDALKDPNLSTIGVHGMGGVGKSTLVMEVQGQALKEKLFETVVKVPVSQNPDLKKIQGEIAAFLNLRLNAEEILGRASELHQRLKKEKVLIILDDVWQKLDLNAVGIPFGEASEGCKILLTSRRKDVLSNEMSTQKEFLLDVLEEEETWRLFEMSVSMANDPELRALANEVANKCAGLPLLIEKVATDLRNKDVYVWKDMLSQLSSSDNTEIYEKVHKVIESSYEKLIDEEAKSLFLLCALFGNSNIQIQDLLMYCMGLGLFKHMDSIEGSRNRALTLIGKLKNESLLLDGDKAGFVKIHDIVRDIATAIASKVQHAFVGNGQIRSTDLESKDCRRISLPYCEISALPEVIQCPEVEVFSVFTEDLSLDLPASYFEGVTKLKVLHFTGMSFVSGLPSSISFLRGLQTLSLNRCKLINIAMVAGLKQLEVLSFAGSDIAELPREITALTRLKLLDLTHCYCLRVIPSNVLSNLNLLEELYMLKSFDRWDRKGNLSIVELKNLSRLTTLEISVKDDKLLPEDWFFNGIQNYRIIVGDWSEFKEASRRMLKLELKTSIGLVDRINKFLGGIEVLYLREVNGLENLSCDSSMEKIIPFKRLRVLHIENCDSLREVLPFSSEKCFPLLQEMKVKSCSNIEAIVGEGSEVEVTEFPQLTSLKLSSLPHLRDICRTSRGMVLFPNLTSLEIYKCNSLKYVFTTSMVKSLKQLEKLNVRFCDSMEEIIHVFPEFEAIGEEVDNINMPVFPELDSVELSVLPTLKRFSSGYPIKFPKLRVLDIQKCFVMTNFVSEDSGRSNNDESTDKYLFNELVTFPNLEIIHFGSMNTMRYLWHQRLADNDSFSKLKLLEIKYCSTLVILFPWNAYTRFRRLESLHVSHCKGLEEIYEYKANALSEAFALRRIDLSYLDSLKHIWSKYITGVLSFPDLQSVEVRTCFKLQHVFPESIACGLPHLQHLKIKNCRVEMITVEAKNEGSHGTRAHAFEWPELKRLTVYNCDELIKFPTQHSHYFLEKVVPNVEALKLSHHSLKRIQSDDQGFPDKLLWKLKEVTLVNLKEESAPFLFDFLRRIYCLETLTFKGGYLGETFSLDDESEVGDQGQQYNLGLRHLHVRGVSKLKHILKKDSELNPIVQFLQILNVSKCHNMINIAPSSVSFINLTTLHIYWCEKMTSLITTSTAKSMIQLTKLKVESCSMMEDIIVANGDCTEGPDDVITFDKLKCLELTFLDNLNSFCSSNYSFNFPVLEEVLIYSCKQLKIFCGGVCSTPKLQVKGNLNAKIARQIQEIGLVEILGF